MDPDDYIVNLRKLAKYTDSDGLFPTRIPVDRIRRRRARKKERKKKEKLM